MGWMTRVALGGLFALIGVGLAPRAAAANDEDQQLAAQAAARQQAIGERRLVLLGEMHGTREIPRFVAALLQRWPAATPRRLALELPRGQQGALDRHFASDCGADARAALRATPYWDASSDQHDGRRSEDMLDLLQQICLWRADGQRIEVFGFDANPGTYRDHHARDRHMAAFLRVEHAAHPDARLLVLTGNVHAMRSLPADAPPQMQQPMGSYLADLQPFAVRIDAREGEIWGCALRSCSARTLTPRPGVGGASSNGVYDWQVLLPRFSLARRIGAPAE